MNTSPVEVPTRGPVRQSTEPGTADLFDLPHLSRYLSERSPQPMVAVEGATHVIRYLNPAFARLVGKAPEELIGRPFAEAVPEDAGNGCVALLDRVFRTGRPENLAEQERHQTPPAYWSYAVWPILGEDDRPAGVMVQVTDSTETAQFRAQATAMNEALMVSAVHQHELNDTIRRGEQERRELELQMFQAQKMESLGILAGGIAHDLNNLLTPVVGFAELASGALPEGSPAAPMLEAVGINARRAADLARQILAYAGKGQFVIEPVDLSALVREMGGLLATVVSINTELRYELAPALPTVEADATQLRQVVMNLVTNASEAVAGRGGTVTVRTGSVPATHPFPGPSPPQSDSLRGPAVFLEVVDTGCGITADVMEKIFDPFFSTKFVGRGLGLAVVQGIARGHHGTLQVRSDPGKGSTFRLLLPASSETRAAPVAPRRSEEWRGTGTVLVIDDEEQVRDVATRILEHAGLTVLVARDGPDGLRMFHEHEREIAAVVLDLTMPQMSGLKVAEELRRVRPALPVILMSGFSVETVTQQSAGLGIAGVVQKPFTVYELVAAVRHVLGQ